MIDAGFDELVRRHWDTLQRGEAVPLDFLVPRRRRAYDFSVKRVGASDIEWHPRQRAAARLDGLLGWFAPAIEVSCRNSERRRMRFEGLTNLRANRDDSDEARIEFPTARESTSEVPDWGKAATESLADGRTGA